jgi:hypothetical protein
MEERTAKKISLVKLIVSYKKNIDKLEIMIKRQNYLRFGSNPEIFFRCL